MHQTSDRHIKQAIETINKEEIHSAISRHIKLAINTLNDQWTHQASDKNNKEKQKPIKQAIDTLKRL